MGSIILFTEVYETGTSLTLEPVSGKIQRVINTGSSAITVTPGVDVPVTIDAGDAIDFWFSGSAWHVSGFKISNYKSDITLKTGKSLQMLATYESISPSFPWFCMSLPDQNWTTANYSTDFIDEMRSRKVTFDELDTNISSFTGSWGTGTDDNKFTLTDNTANNSITAELYEEWLFEKDKRGSDPVTSWRLLHDGTNEFNITSIAGRVITVNKDGKTPSGTSISIYLHRVYGSATSARHFSWAGLGLYMCGGGKVSGLRRRDAMQGHRHIQGYGTNASYSPRYGEVSGVSTTIEDAYGVASRTIAPLTGDPYTDGTYGTPRTASKTRIESGTVLIYLYAGSYTA